MGRAFKGQTKKNLGGNFRREGAHAAQVPLFPSILFYASAQFRLLQWRFPYCCLLLSPLKPGHQVSGHKQAYPHVCRPQARVQRRALCSIYLFIFMKVELIYNVVLISGVQQSDSVIRVYIFFFILFSIMVFPFGILNIVLCATHQDLVVYLRV